ncbi:peptide chain release factor N(5)-glutamine methyltransferase [Roseisolibacter sp. H3M3-2]|uniref:peptide chain release factor N(5)-glutamine methyltransferase n=1 Tax=Roseisolibacter sp. H3M3-2 TaxID=3031323 RepID=UPI0023DC9056|nr:peptide chain release factor N(5)-glutamine methyltransferase [Roseisolibacter sp. H3M3-2]MDF1505274.1 peptide chain release factor N(5)-glutamine methyltransferase [Roseisolibacter sp. H3M3-2]
MTEPGVEEAPASVGALVREVAAALATAHVPEARDEARDLVAALLDQPRFWPSVHRDEPVDAALVGAARAAATKRGRGAPFAYAVGRAAFRHLTLDVDERVLIPRQETEVLVDEVLAYLGGRPGGTVVDVGTGSGAIALALACEGRPDRVIATDVSLDALAVAGRNVALLRDALCAPVELRHGSALAPVAALGAGALRVVVSNPPYIAFGEAAQLPAAVRDWEPPLALYAAREGMALIAQLVREAAPLLAPGGLLAMEVDARRAILAAELAMSDGRYDDVAVRLDLAGRERFVLAVRR